MSLAIDPQLPSSDTSVVFTHEIVSLADGTTVTIRPIELADAAELRRMFARLSDESAYHRFFSPVPVPRRAVLAHLTGINHDRREALVALTGGEIVAIANYDCGPQHEDAEVAVTVEDAWQGRGVGTMLLRRLAKLAAARGIPAFRATVLGENRGALRFLRRLNPDADVRFEQGEYVVYAPLRTGARGRSAAR